MVIKTLSAWQSTRKWRAPACRFYPTCSEYSKQAFEKFEFFGALRLSLVRIIKCHPFHDGGVDEVPEQMTPVLALNVMKSLQKSEFRLLKGRIFSRHTWIRNSCCAQESDRSPRPASLTQR
ncbi:MAG: membrane protein insertion efficiency factor YidD [Leptolyngbya sp.]|nr:membrane protein insertion efficiency factor YidD [Candidatus Melainabacteria bacterium]